MALIGTDDLRCPACAHGFAVPAARSLGPAARPPVLAGRLHLFTCPLCHQALRHERPLVYLDGERGHAVYVRPPEDQPDFERWETLAERAFRRVGAEAPLMWQQQAARIRLRLVFGLPALREKLLIWDAGLDDALVEGLKRDLQLRKPALRGELRLAQVDEDLMLTSTSARVRVSAARYRRFEALRPELAEAWPALFRGPYVDAARLTRL